MVFSFSFLWCIFLIASDFFIHPLFCFLIAYCLYFFFSYFSFCNWLIVSYYCCLKKWWILFISPYQLSSVHSLSHARLFPTPLTAAHQASLSITNSWSFLKLISIESVMPSKNLIFCHLLHFMPSIFPTMGVFSNESILCIRWQKYWSFSFSISLSSEYSGLISFRMDRLDLLAVQGTLKSLL